MKCFGVWLEYKLETAAMSMLITIGISTTTYVLSKNANVLFVRKENLFSSNSFLLYFSFSFSMSSSCDAALNFFFVMFSSNQKIVLSVFQGKLLTFLQTFNFKREFLIFCATKSTTHIHSSNQQLHAYHHDHVMILAAHFYALLSAWPILLSNWNFLMHNNINNTWSTQLTFRQNFYFRGQFFITCVTKSTCILRYIITAIPKHQYQLPVKPINNKYLCSCMPLNIFTRSLRSDSFLIRHSTNNCNCIICLQVRITNTKSKKVIKHFFHESATNVV